MDDTNFISNTNPNYKLTIDDMWKINNTNLENVIEGYEVNKVYFDHYKFKNDKKVWEKMISKKVRADWPPHDLKDESGNVNWPKKKNYLDDVYKTNLYFLRMIKNIRGFLIQIYLESFFT
jgi:hypothetical protein